MAALQAPSTTVQPAIFLYLPVSANKIHNMQHFQQATDIIKSQFFVKNMPIELGSLWR